MFSFIVGISPNPPAHGVPLNVIKKMTVNDDTRAAAETSLASSSKHYNELIHESVLTGTTQINQSPILKIVI